MPFKGQYMGDILSVKWGILIKPNDTYDTEKLKNVAFSLNWCDPQGSPFQMKTLTNKRTKLGKHLVQLEINSDIKKTDRSYTTGSWCRKMSLNCTNCQLFMFQCVF